MVKKVKDIVYDVNDVIVVFVILVLAALLIWSRLDVIMAYPMNGGEGTLVATEEQDEGGGAVTNVAGDGHSQAGPADGSDGALPETGGDGAGGQDASGQQAAAAGPGEEAMEDDYPYAVYVNPGETAAKIAQTLLDAEIISDKNEFYDAIIAAKAETKLLAGQFIIPKRSTPADIVRILTGG